MFIKVKVYPESPKKEIIKKTEDYFEIKIKEKAQRGEANKKVIEILSKYLNILPFRIRLVKGARQQNKIFEIRE